MNDDTFNMQTRKFLKQVGVTGQRALEDAVKAALASGCLQGNEVLTAKAVITIDILGLRHEVEGSIALE